MSDDPFYAPNRTIMPAGHTPGLEVWTQRKDDRMLTCELDVQILDQDRWPLIAQRCVNRAGAEFVAASYRRAFLRQGWKDRSQRVI